MAKALMQRVYNVVQAPSGGYDFTADVVITIGNNDSQVLNIEINCANFSDPQSVRRNAWRTAIIAKAYQDLEVVVDEVQFEDFSV